MEPHATSKPRSERGAVRGELILAAAVASLGGFLLLRVSQIEFGAGYDRIGPRFFPYVIALGLILLGGSLAFMALRDGKRNAAAAAVPPSATLNWMALGYLSLALIVCLALLERAGFIIACSIQFWLAARAFHSRRPARDAVVAVALSVMVYFAFSHLLGLTLPAGVFENLFWENLF